MVPVLRCQKDWGILFIKFLAKKLPEIRNTRFLVFVCPSLSRNKIKCQELDQFPTLMQVLGAFLSQV